MSGLRFGAIVLAAGKSSRMGRNKLLITINGRMVIDRLLDVLEDTVDKIVVVTGYNPESIQNAVKSRDIKLVHNSEFEKGMTSSVRAGLSIVRDMDAVFLVPGDQLGIDANLIEKMKKTIIEDQEALIVSPIFEGKRGHPILFRNLLFNDVLLLSEEMTLRDLVKRYEFAHRFVESDEWCTRDFDTPNDLENAKKYWQSN